MRLSSLLAATLAPALGLACGAAEGDPNRSAPAVAEGPLVLELFTSQGCSSCPPADRLLAKIEGANVGRPVAPLSFHVDYWNDLGWADPYSAPAWTARQHQYANALKDDRVYTPELVVGGAAGVLGSNALAVQSAITGAPHPALLAATATWSADKLAVTTTAPPDADVFVAVWESSTSTKVPRGENAGETLSSTRVVRRLERVAAAGQRGTVTVPLDAAWRAPGAVAFAQRADRRITASALLPR